MQKITFGGTEYVRASEVAKKFRYTQDYVGQLCRNKKVNARLVGRNWYVDLDSVTAYRKTKHKTQKQQTQKTNTAKSPSPKAATEPTKTKQKTVIPVVRAKTARMAEAARRPVASHNQTTPVSYSTDEETLVPVLHKPVQAHSPDQAKAKQSVTVDTRPAAVIPVAAPARTEVSFTSEKLPEISLSGKLKLKNYTEEKSEKTAKAAVDSKKESGQPTKQPVASTKNQSENDPASKQPPLENVRPRPKVSKSTSERQAADTETPSAELTETDRPSRWGVMNVLFFSGLLALLMVIGIFGTEYELQVVGEEVAGTLRFSLQNLLKFTENL